MKKLRVKFSILGKEERDKSVNFAILIWEGKEHITGDVIHYMNTDEITFRISRITLVENSRDAWSSNVTSVSLGISQELEVEAELIRDTLLMGSIVEITVKHPSFMSYPS